MSKYANRNVGKEIEDRNETIKKLNAANADLVKKLAAAEKKAEANTELAKNYDELVKQHTELTERYEKDRETLNKLKSQLAQIADLPS